MLRVLGSHLAQAPAPAPAATAINTDTKETLCTSEEIDGFMEDGYLALPAILTQSEQDDLRADVDRLEEDRVVHRAQKTEPPFIVEYDSNHIQVHMKACVTNSNWAATNSSTLAAHFHSHFSLGNSSKEEPMVRSARREELAIYEADMAAGKLGLVPAFVERTLAARRERHLRAALQSTSDKLDRALELLSKLRSHTS